MLRGLKRLNRYENRILSILKNNDELVRLKQLGFSAKNREGFKFPIHAIEVGTKKAIQKNPVGLVAGVHGLETIGIRVLLDFLDYITNPKHSKDFSELEKGKLGIVCIPILNPGGVALKSRSNPNGVDLMRNSGIDSEKAVPFLGGHKLSGKLPYFRGNTLQKESRILQKFVEDYFFKSDGQFMILLDIHSGFGVNDSVWWPYAGTKKYCEDQPIYEKISKNLLVEKALTKYKFGPQSEIYTAHGDLWDKFYDDFLEVKRNKKWKPDRKFLPLTLEIGTWADLKNNPLKIFRKRGLFNPTNQNKEIFIKAHRDFLTSIVKLTNSKLTDFL
ncbi:MAG: DUF2817 domain-containing protein [Leptospiraceae bacterium]|nr:DUF2817 domain-containing protein [Leptospiraceae bacterium]